MVFVKVCFRFEKKITDYTSRDHAEVLSKQVLLFFIQLQNFCHPVAGFKNCFVLRNWCCTALASHFPWDILSCNLWAHRCHRHVDRCCIHFSFPLSQGMPILILRKLLRTFKNAFINVVWASDLSYSIYYVAEHVPYCRSYTRWLARL